MINRTLQGIKNSIISVLIWIIFGFIVLGIVLAFGNSLITAVIVFIFVILIIVYNKRFENAKGNISKYDLKNKDLVWMDNRLSNSSELDRRISIYKIGVRYLNYVIEWGKMKEMYFPKSIKYAQNVGNIIGDNYFAKKTTNTLKIVDENKKTYLIEIVNYQGFISALEKIKKLYMLK